MENQQVKEKAKRGFAVMPPDLRRNIASKGGKIAHQKGVAHEWTPAEAKEAGRKGGSVAAVHRRLNRSENDGRDDIL